MPEFNDVEGVRRWLAGKPDAIAIVLASRMALRVLPTIAAELETQVNDPAHISQVFLSTFRAAGVAWAAGRYPPFIGGLRNAAEAATKFNRGPTDQPLRPVARRAAYAAALAVVANATRRAVAVFENAIEAPAAYGRAAYVAAFAAAAKDAEAFEEEVLPPEDIAARPLWPSARPRWFDHAWGRAKNLLVVLPEDWSAWTEWYEDRLAGAPDSGRTEIARATIPDEIWVQGAQAVNGRIDALLRREGEAFTAALRVRRKRQRRPQIPRISDFNDLERWLRDKPREWSVVIAARAALRVAPALVDAVRAAAHETERAGRDIILPTLRGMAAPWVAATYPTHGAEVAFAAAAAAADAARAAAAAAAAFWSAVEEDVFVLDEGLKPNELAGKKLWPRGMPRALSDAWNGLKRALIVDNADWDVWTTWYQARLDGRRSNEDLEVARVMIAEDIWRDGPRAVNAEIKRLIEEHEPPEGRPDNNEQSDLGDNALPPIENLPRQIPRALVFGGDENAPIGLIDPPGEGLYDTPDQRQGHTDVREKALVLESSCGSSNRLAILKSHVSKLIKVMGASLAELQVRAFWSQMNSLRRRAEADERARRSQDPESPPLADDVAGALKDLVETLNVFAAHEPKLVALDELARDPAERAASDDTIAASRDIAAAAAASSGAVKREAADSMGEAVAEATGTTAASERAKEFAVNSARNLVLEVVRRSYKAVLNEPRVLAKGVREGAYRTAGGVGAAYSAALFIKAYEVPVRTLIDTLGGSASLHRIVDLIIRTLS